MPRSLRETVSALKCWSTFAREVLGLGGRELPPTVDGLAAWSRMFRSKHTFCNYVGKLKLACELAKVSTVSLEHPSVRRCKRTLTVMQRPPKPKMFIQKPLLVQLVTLALEEGDCYAAWLYILAYAFLLRVPSEGEVLPIL